MNTGHNKIAYNILLNEDKGVGGGLLLRVSISFK